MSEQLQPVNHAPLVISGVLFDPNLRAITFRGQTISLTPMAFRVTHHFFSRIGHVCTRQELLSEIWGYDARLQTRRVDAQISRLRRLLQSLGCPFEVVSSRNEGYQLIAGTEGREP